MKRYFVYELVDPQTLNPFYIGAGSGRSDAKRLADHIGETRLDPVKWTNPEKTQYVKRLLDAGLKPLLTIHECVDETHCSITERQLIKQYGRLVDGGILTNRGTGGEGIKGVRHGANKNGRLKPKCVYQFDLEGNLLKCFPAVTQAAGEIGVSHTAIINACRGTNNTKSAGGYQWSYTDVSPGVLKTNPRARRSIYRQYSLDGEFIAEYKTGQDVKRFTGIDPSAIIKHLNGILHHAGGYTWTRQKEGE